MRRRFNVTGNCNPKRHYMVDVSGKFAHVREMVEYGEYFIINRPRQFGKTTMMGILASKLSSEYELFNLSFEGVGDDLHQSMADFATRFAAMFARDLRHRNPELAAKTEALAKPVCDWTTLSDFISDFIRAAGRPTLLLIDEVDRSINSQIFLSFLGLLRQKYLARDQGDEPTFQAVVLAGVHDIKSLKLKVREGGETKLNSPWNIAADFNVDMSFNPAEIETLLADFASENPVQMEMPAIAERIHYFSNGHPFLVSKLCKILDEEAGSQNPHFAPAHWTVADIDWAFRWLTRDEYTTTNFDDLVKNLENNPDLYELAFIVSFGIDSEKRTLSAKDPIVSLGLQYGIFGHGGGGLCIHNRVYEQVIYDYLRSRQLTKGRGYGFGEYLLGPYFSADGRLQLKAVLQRFQAFMREHYSAQDAAFLEREGRLIFMSFLKPIINGRGFMWKEPVVGDERRMDLVVTFGQDQKEVLELKLWRGEAYHQAGLQQLSDYLDFHGLKRGYLLIFDFRKGKETKQEAITFADKIIDAVWV
jgi:hypothetical protein